MTMTSMNKIYGGAYALPHLGIAGLHDPIMTLEADVSVKRRERAARLGGRSHAGRDFTAPEKLSFLSSLTDHCFRVCGVLELDNPHHVGALAFLLILSFGAFWSKRKERTPQTERRRIPEHDHVRRPAYRVKGTLQQIHFENPVSASAAKALVDGEFWDASERRVRWDVFETERTTPKGKAAPRIL